MSTKLSKMSIKFSISEKTSIKLISYEEQLRIISNLKFNVNNVIFDDLKFSCLEKVLMDLNPGIQQEIIADDLSIIKICNYNNVITT